MLRWSVPLTTSFLGLPSAKLKILTLARVLPRCSARSVKNLINSWRLMFPLRSQLLRKVALPNSKNSLSQWLQERMRVLRRGKQDFRLQNKPSWKNANKKERSSSWTTIRARVELTSMLLETASMLRWLRWTQLFQRLNNNQVWVLSQPRPNLLKLNLQPTSQHVVTSTSTILKASIFCEKLRYEKLKIFMSKKH